MPTMAQPIHINALTSPLNKDVINIKTAIKTGDICIKSYNSSAIYVLEGIKDLKDN
jgi:hypothetical protein